MCEYIELLFVAALWGLGLWASMSERKAWNNGICKQTGLPWEYFDTDSQSGRGYKSEGWYTWVSWPGIDNGIGGEKEDCL